MRRARLCGLPLAAIVAASLGGHSVAQSAPLAPHRAVYDLTLDASKSSSKVDQANGRIAFEMLGDACQGYAVTLRQVTRLDSGEGRRTTSDLHSVTWENGAATKYRFETKNYFNENLRDDVDGTAERGRDGGVRVRLTRPKVAPFDVTGAVVFPTEHLNKLLAAGAADERILEAKVYDGAPDGKKVYDTLAVIGEATTGGEGLEEPARTPMLSAMKRYPVTVSYFEQGAGERTPAYVLGFELYENGISRALKLDYGGFALRGELAKLELLKPTDCDR